MRKIYFLLSLLLVGSMGRAQIFSNPITGTNPNTANPYTTGQTVDPNMTVSGIGRGAGITGTNANDRYNANSWNTAAIDATAYFEFTLTPNAGFEIDLTSFVYTAQASGTGPTTFAFRSSVDGFTADIGTPTVSGTTISLTGAAYQNINTTITFRFYGWGTTQAGGTFSINDFSFNGAVVPIGGSTATLANITPQPSGTILQGANDVVLAGFSVTPSASVDFTNVTVTGTGTATATDITAIRIFRDNNANGAIDGADASVSGAGVAYAASMPMIITGETGFSTARNYLIVANVAGVGISTPGNTVTASIASGAFTTTATVNSGSATGNSRAIVAPPGATTITAGPASEPATLSSLINTQGASVINFDFTILDDGATPATDGAATQISQIVFNTGIGNGVTNWLTAIAGVELSDGTNTTTTATIAASSITFAGISNAPGQLGYIGDDANKTYTLRIWLNANLGALRNVIDGQDFVFRIQTSGVTTTGSQLASGQDVSSGDGNNTVTVTATQLAFVQQPSNTNINSGMAPAVTVSANDANGNRDLDFTSSIEITSTGTLTGSPVAQAAAAGLATFTGLTHTAAGTGLTLNAERSGTLDWDITSNAFNIAVAPVITEITFPQYAMNGGTTSQRLQYVCKLQLDNLTPNATYRYFSSASTATSLGASVGPGNFWVINNTSGANGYIVGQSSAKSAAGTLMSGDEFTTGNRYGEFTTDASGSYTGWFAITPSGNAVFNTGNDVYFYVQINDGAGGTSIAQSLRSTNTFEMLDAANSSPVAGSSHAPAAENFVMLYDNTLGTGRPLYVSWVENDGITTNYTAWYNPAYDGVAGSWGAIVPSALPNGVRRIVFIDITSSVKYIVTSTDGVWGATNTVNPTAGTTPLVINKNSTGTDGDFMVGNNLSLTSPVTIEGTLILGFGELLTTSTNILTLRPAATVSQWNPTSFVAGPMLRETNSTSPYLFPVGKAGVYKPFEVLPASADPSTFGGEYFGTGINTTSPSCNPARLEAYVNNEYWDISRSAGAANARIRLNYTAANSNGNWTDGSTIVADPTATKGITIAHYNATCWQDENGSTLIGSSASGQVTSRVLSSFSPFTFGYGALATLPVSFGNIRATQQGSGVKIEWSNFTELEVLHYTVERSLNGRDYISISNVTPVLNDGRRADYNIIDAAPVNGINYYRVRSAETNGLVKYSTVVKVDLRGGRTDITLYPNPLNGNNLSLQATGLAKGQYNIKVFNAAGQQVAAQTLNHNGGSITGPVQLPVALKAGLYQFVITSDAMNVTKTFIVQ